MKPREGGELLTVTGWLVAELGLEPPSSAPLGGGCQTSYCPRPRGADIHAEACQRTEGVGQGPVVCAPGLGPNPKPQAWCETSPCSLQLVSKSPDCSTAAWATASGAW